MDKTIRTPHLSFRRRRIRPMYSEHFSYDNQMDQEVAQPLFESGVTVAAVASELGYESLHSFTRLFTKHVGMPPGRYRARYGTRAD